MEALTGIPEGRNRSIDEELIETLSQINLKLSHLDRTEKNISVDVLRINLLKMFGIVIFAIGVTATSMTAYTGILNKLDRLEEQMKGIRSDSKSKQDSFENALGILRREMLNRTSDRFQWSDAEELSYRLCNEIEKSTNKKVNCPLVNKRKKYNTGSIKKELTE